MVGVELDMIVTDSLAALKLYQEIFGAEAEVYNRAMAAGCSEVQPVVEMEAMGMMNALFFDPFGYMWMLHQIVKVVSFEDRCRIMEKQIGLKEKAED